MSNSRIRRGRRQLLHQLSDNDVAVNCRCCLDAAAATTVAIFTVFGTTASNKMDLLYWFRRRITPRLDTNSIAVNVNFLSLSMTFIYIRSWKKGIRRAH